MRFIRVWAARRSSESERRTTDLMALRRRGSTSPAVELVAFSINPATTTFSLSSSIVDNDFPQILAKQWRFKFVTLLIFSRFSFFPENHVAAWSRLKEAKSVRSIWAGRFSRNKITLIPYRKEKRHRSLYQLSNDNTSTDPITNLTC